MKCKTSTRISIIFSVFTFCIISVILLLLNIYSFYAWYNEEKQEVAVRIDSKYKEILINYDGSAVQKENIIEDLRALGLFIDSGQELEKYKKIFADFYSLGEYYYVVNKKETKFGTVFVAYEVTYHYSAQIRIVKMGLFLLFLFTVLSFAISKLLFTKLALKDIFFITNKLRKIDLNNIKKIDLKLNENDEINTILYSINNFLDIIDKNTKSLKHFNSQVSHELKTPLMVISSELEYIALSGKKNESYKKIEKHIDILNNLLDTFLFISKIENFNGNIKKDDLNIFDIISEKIDVLDSIYSSKKIKIIKNIDKKIKLKTNKKLFDILLQNLLSNAFKYNKKGGTIEIILDKKSLIIKDSGIGIKKEEISKIFDSFYRINNKVRGHGLGLNIAKKIIDILDYKIEIKSKKDVGTEFIIIFR